MADSPKIPQARLAFPRKTAPQVDGIVEGEVVRVTYESEDTGFRVLRVRVEGESELQTVVGVFPASPPGSHIRATGERIEDKRHGSQFKATSVLTVAPSTLEGLERYLASGIVPGVGPAYAKRIVETFGERTLEVLDRAPERLADVPGLGGARIRGIVRAWAAHRDVGAIMVFLQSHNVSPALATRIYKRFGQKAMAIVSASPYRLALDVWGIGFKTADAIAHSIGIAKDAPERIQAGVLHALHEIAGQGHTYAPRNRLIEFVANLLDCDPDLVPAALETLDGDSRIVTDPRTSDVAAEAGETTSIYSPGLFQAECAIADNLVNLLSQASPIDRPERAITEFERISGLTLAEQQAAAIHLAAKHAVVVITGGPGVGKTTIVRALLALFDSARISVALAAPTGRAAKRLFEATGREAKTLHRLLIFDPKNGRFKSDAENPIDAGAVVIDETSMVDTELMAALSGALAPQTRLVLVGDVDQLPSVGAGAVLRDVIASGEVPTVRLKTIFRQSAGSGIVANAHQINSGEMPAGADDSKGQFYILERKDAGDAVSLIRTLVKTRIPKGFGIPSDQIQVLTPMQRGPVGAIALNLMLQEALNPTGEEVTRGQRTLRVGDRVMQLRNNYDKNVFNGDIGSVAQIESGERTLTVNYESRLVPYKDTELDELSLAYATTIHKSQGSEYSAIVIPVLTQHFVMLSRNLLYTGVTRGKRLVVLVADPRALRIALAEVRKESRQTHLAPRIREALGKLDNQPLFD